MTARALAAAALAGLVPVAAGAQTTENRFGGSASATLAYSNNPFSQQNGNGGTTSTSSPLAVLDVTPTFQHLTEHSVLSISADANLQQYFRRYGGNNSYSGAIDYRLRPAARVSAHLRLDLASAVLGSFNSFVPPVTATPLPVTGAPATTTTVPGAAANGNALPVDPTLLYPSSPLLTDIGLYGLRTRRRTARASGDASIGVTERDSLTVSTYAEVARYGGGANGVNFGDYEAYSGTLGYQRRVSAYINLGVQGTASLFNYRTTGSTRVYAVAATATGRLSPHWTLDGSLGASFVSGASAGSTRSTSPSGSVSLCRQGERSVMCAQASRQVSATGVGSSQYVTTAGLNWSRRLSERDGLSLNATYSNIGGGRVLLVPGGLPLQTQYGQASLGYDRRLRQRLRFVASANVRQLLDGGNGRPADFGGQVGLSYQFGNLR